MIELATLGLDAYPNNAEMLRRQALANCRIVTEKGDSPFLAEGEADLRTLLAFEPHNLRGALNLLGELFTFSGLEDSEVAWILDHPSPQPRAQSSRELGIRA